MNVLEIQKFLATNKLAKDKYLKITFKKRDAIYGIFVQGNDHADLEPKNFWRIVTFTHFEEYNKSKNINLAKIFSGSEFTKISVV